LAEVLSHTRYAAPVTIRSVFNADFIDFIHGEAHKINPLHDPAINVSASADPINLLIHSREVTEDQTLL
jgi:hypothetical protein